MSKGGMMSWMAFVMFMAVTVLWPGCKKSDDGGGPTEGPGGIITVTGRAVGLNLQPLQHVPVAIAGRPATVSDDSGAFTITGVQTPYDVTVIDPATSSALMYLGLTRNDPTLIWLTQAPGTIRSGSLTGTVAGGTFGPTQGANDATEILFLTSSTAATASIDGAQTGDFGMGAEWYGPNTTTGTLYALQFTTDAASGLPVAGGFKAFGIATGVTMTDGGLHSGQALAMQALAPSQTGQFTATIELPPGFTLQVKTLLLRPNANGLIPIVDDTTPATSVSYYAPVITDATVTVHARASNVSGASTDVIKGGLGVGGGAQTVTASQPPELSLPVADASFVDTTTEFSWRPLVGGVHIVSFSPVAGGNPEFIVVTTGQSCRLPNLKLYGVTLPKAQQYTWTVTAFGPVSGVDQAAEAGILRPIRRPGEITSTVVSATTPTRPFRTAP